MKLVSKIDKFIWEIVNVYGPAQTDRKQHFLDELTQKITDMSDPFIMGGGTLILSDLPGKNPLKTLTSSG
jgi:hypothetical protein